MNFFQENYDAWGVNLNWLDRTLLQPHWDYLDYLFSYHGIQLFDPANPVLHQWVTTFLREAWGYYTSCYLQVSVLWLPEFIVCSISLWPRTVFFLVCFFLFIFWIFQIIKQNKQLKNQKRLLINPSRRGKHIERKLRAQ